MGDTYLVCDESNELWEPDLSEAEAEKIYNDHIEESPDVPVYMYKLEKQHQG